MKKLILVTLFGISVAFAAEITDSSSNCEQKVKKLEELIDLFSSQRSAIQVDVEPTKTVKADDKTKADKTKAKNLTCQQKLKALEETLGI